MARSHTHTHTLAWHLIAMQECSKSSGCVGDSLQSSATHDSPQEVQKLGFLSTALACVSPSWIRSCLPDMYIMYINV